MKKLKIIIGPPSSGKSRLARRILETYPEDEVAFFEASKSDIDDPFFFSGCTMATKVIVIDDIQDVQCLFRFLYFTSHGASVESQGKKKFNIYPEFILICNESVTIDQIRNMGPSLTRRLEIIELHRFRSITFPPKNSKQ